MAVKVDSIRFRVAGETVRLEYEGLTYQAVADRDGKLHFYECGEQVEQLLPEESGLTLEEIVLSAESRHRCTLEQIKTGGNWPHLVKARREIAIRLRGQGYSLPRIGLVLGKHHTTVLHLLRTGAERKSA